MSVYWLYSDEFFTELYAGAAIICHKKMQKNPDKYSQNSWKKYIQKISKTKIKYCNIQKASRSLTIEIRFVIRENPKDLLYSNYAFLGIGTVNQIRASCENLKPEISHTQHL